ncbi:MAG: PorV/PorQ family protein [candidate division KSB1 bacterium]|nr:PorV/PorQ family protein [candidate division KSB1 bacterium]MDZ7273690.1 PorV/PorQ family protein [candidate division KSB1 bacterium]MDZ7285846.1 PorV/PorQ family protein [candidate division KSB1 bacterium]MDZ7298878.1 PorV/PorQ family protein [candidate division KSB1 bacterium]MDZ7307076.1 PorV/PorQ family protein [candidate division KSB1 bacterium]
MKKLLSLFAAFLFPTLVLAQATGYNFLRTPVGARQAAMAASFISVSQDAHSIYYNPAGLADLTKRTATFGYLNNILDVQDFYGAYVMPYKQGSYGFALQYTDYGDFTRTNEFGEELGHFGANNIVAYFSYSRMPAARLLLGGNVKYIRATLADFSSDAVALDLGMIYHSSLFDNLSFGAGIFNLGRVRKAFDGTREALPLTFQFGISKRLAHLPLLYSLTLVADPEENLQFRAGGEFTLTPNAFLRLGYNTLGRDQKVGTDNDRFAGLSLGLGLNYRQYKLDYGMSSFGEIGNLNRLSLSILF